MADDAEVELVYDGDCPYCRRIASLIDGLDPGDMVRLTDIESERGRRLIEQQHGRFIHSPHLFTPEYAYYGLGPVARRLAIVMPQVTALGLARRLRQALGSSHHDPRYGGRNRRR